MIQAAYLDHMGTDLTVANAARVSFGKRADSFRDQDARLLGFLARNDHWTPFAHPQVSLHVKAPVFVRAQCFKHKVGFVENEISRRYVDDEPSFYTPAKWRGRVADKKQGSADNLPQAVQCRAEGVMAIAIDHALDAYEALLDAGIAPEQARMVLPQAMITEWVWTGSLAAWARFCRLRQAKDAQAETGEVAWLCAEIIGPLFPVSWAVLSGVEIPPSDAAAALAPVES